VLKIKPSWLWKSSKTRITSSKESKNSSQKYSSKNDKTKLLNWWRPTRYSASSKQVILQVAALIIASPAKVCIDKCSLWRKKSESWWKKWHNWRNLNKRSRNSSMVCWWSKIMNWKNRSKIWKMTSMSRGASGIARNKNLLNWTKASDKE